MKDLLLFLVGCTLTTLSAQSVDSIFIKRVDSLIQVARTFAGKEDFDKALEANIAAQKFARENLGEESAAYGSCCMAQGALYYFMGEFVNAETWYLKAKSNLAKTLGKDHLDYAKVLNNLAVLYKNMGRYEQAELLYLETITITEKKLGKENPDYCWVLSNLATLYQKMGRFDQAERYFIESMGIREKSFGRHHPEYAASLSNLSLLYHERGQLSKAEPLALEAKTIREQTLEKDDPDYAESLNNLANLYADLGSFNKAESYYLEEQALYEKILGREHPDYAMCLINLVTLYQEMNQFEKAIPLLQEAMNIQERSLGKDHPDYTASMNLMSNLWRNRGQNEKALPLLQEALNILEKKVGKQHPNYLAAQINLAALLVDMGKYLIAEPYLLEAKRIYETGIVNRTQLNYLNCLYTLSTLYTSLGQYQKVEPLIVEYAKMNRKLLENAMDHLSERELNEYIKIFSKKQDQVYSYLEPTSNGVLAGVSFDNSLFYKGFLLMAISQLINKANSDPATTQQYNILRACRQRLAGQYSVPLAEQDSLLVATLEKQSEEIEKQLARTVAGYAEAKLQVHWQEVQSALKPGDAAVEFVNFHCFQKNEGDSIQYAALLLKPGDKQQHFIPLFEEKSLDSLLHFKSDRKSDYVNRLYTLADRGAISIEAPKKSLYEILWKPLEKELIGIKTIYYSPSGLLHRINLDAIPISETETLADKYQVIELNSTRQLVIPTPLKNVNNEAVLYGGIQFEQDTSLHKNEPLLASRSRGEMSFGNVDTTLRGGSWTYLAGTEREVNAITKIREENGIQAKLKKGYAATEESFKSIGVNNSPSPRILHIATHGYFFPDVKQKNKESILNSQLEPVFKISEHPMLRSGLILAGGNAAWQGKQTLEGREDGILTAYEISQMNLSNTELVVLSACETGLGDIQGNEGVYGLQRAFKIAGAKYLIMSLWQVPDKQTSLLMTTFYKKWLELKMTIPDAFHAAQKELREAGLDPYQWAGFILVE